MGKSQIFIVRSLMLFAVLLQGSGLSLGAEASGKSAAPARSILAPLKRSLFLTGELRSVHATSIRVPSTSQSTLQISWIIEDGAEVKKGDRVLEFDSTTFQNMIDETRISLDSALQDSEQEKAQSEAKVIAARLRFERARIARAKAELMAGIPERLISQKDYQQHKVDLHRAQVEYEKAEDEMKVARKVGELNMGVHRVKISRIRRRLRAAENALEKLVIEAPEDGIITVAEHPWEDRKFKEGDSPWAGLGVLRMPKLDTMAVKAELYDVDDGLIHPAMDVVCVLDAYPDLSFSGVITDITPIAQEVRPFTMRRAFEVSVDLENSDPGRMLPGMSVRVEVPIPSETPRILAPRWTLMNDSDVSKVHLADHSWKEVSLGPCSDQYCVVLSGLAEGVSLISASRAGK